MIRHSFALAGILVTSFACARSGGTAAKTAIPPQPASVGGVKVAGATVTNMPRGDVRQFTPVVASVDSGGQCRPVPSGMTTDGERMLLYRFEVGGSTVRNIALQLDKAGNIIRYSDIRGDLRMPPSDPGTSNWGPQTSITMDGRSGTSVLSNRRRAEDNEMMMVSAAAMLDAPNLGTPRRMMAHVRRVCG